MDKLPGRRAAVLQLDGRGGRQPERVGETAHRAAGESDRSREGQGSRRRIPSASCRKLQATVLTWALYEFPWDAYLGEFIFEAWVVISNIIPK